MKILHLIDNFDYCDGCARYVYLLAREQNRNGNEISIIVGQGDAIELLHREGWGIHIVPEIVHSKRSVSFFFWGMIKIQKIIKQFQPSVIHTHHFYAANLTLRYPRLKRPPIVHTVHQSIPRGILPMYVGDKIIAVSESIKNDILQIYPQYVSTLSVVPTASDFLEIDDDALSLETLELLRKETLGYFTIAFIGRMVEAKGIYILTDALRKIHNQIPYHAFYIGDGVEKKNIEAQSKSAGLNVSFIRSQKSIKKYLMLADVVVVPSLQFEGLPMIILEAGLLKKAVIVSGTNGIPEIITHEENGIIIQPGNSDELSSALLKLYSDQLLRLKLGENLFVSVSSTRSVKKMAESVDAIYQSLI